MYLIMHTTKSDPWRRWFERQTSKQEVVKLSPTIGIFSLCNYLFPRVPHSSTQPIQMKSDNVLPREWYVFVDLV